MQITTPQKFKKGQSIIEPTIAGINCSLILPNEKASTILPLHCGQETIELPVREYRKPNDLAQ